MKERLIKSQFLAKVTTISSYVWLASTLMFWVVIFLSTKFFQIDPSYSPGGAQEQWLLPMLSSLFLGLATFGLTISGGFLRKVLKADKWNPPLRIGAGKTGLAAFIVTGFALVYILGAFHSGVSFGGSYSGQEIFDAVNAQRVSVGVKPVKLNEYICDNLVERWRMARAGKYHEGFDTWAKGLNENFSLLGEILVTAPTPKDAVYYWTTSPGHRTTMEDPQWTDGCAYAAEGTAVMVFGRI